MSAGAVVPSLAEPPAAAVSADDRFRRGASSRPAIVSDDKGGMLMPTVGTETCDRRRGLIRPACRS